MNRSHIIYAVFLVSTLLSLSLNSKAETITIAYNDAWPPYSSGSLDQAQGILIDLMDYLLADEPGLEIQHIGLPWNRVQTSIRSGRSDLFISVPTQQRLEYSYTSEQIIYEMHMLEQLTA